MRAENITTNVVNSKSRSGEVYSIQHYVMKFVSDLRATGWWFPTDTPVSSTNKTDLHDITEILALSTKKSQINHQHYTIISSLFYLQLPMFLGFVLQ